MKENKNKRKSWLIQTRALVNVFGFCVVLGIFFSLWLLRFVLGFSLQLTEMLKLKPVLIKSRFWGGSSRSDLCPVLFHDHDWFKKMIPLNIFWWSIQSNLLLRELGDAVLLYASLYMNTDSPTPHKSEKIQCVIMLHFVELCVIILSAVPWSGLRQGTFFFSPVLNALRTSLCLKQA